MPRIAGVDLPRNKRVEIGLTYLHGIGRSRSNEILAIGGVDPDTRVAKLAEDEITRIRMVIDRNYLVEGDLRREVSENIRRLKEIGSYCGMRHRLNLPVRGQRIKTELTPGIWTLLRRFVVQTRGTRRGFPIFMSAL